MQSKVNANMNDKRFLFFPLCFVHMFDLFWFRFFNFEPSTPLNWELRLEKGQHKGSVRFVVFTLSDSILLWPLPTFRKRQLIFPGEQR